MRNQKQSLYKIIKRLRNKHLDASNHENGNKSNEKKKKNFVYARTWNVSIVIISSIR